MKNYSSYMSDHTWSEWEHGRDATCNSYGYESHTCTVCGVVERAVYHPTEHIWGELEEIKAPTCTEVGEGRHTCTMCGKVENYTTEYAPHTWGEGELIKAPTCTEFGEKMYTCLVCGTTMTEWIDPANAHDFGEWQVVSEPTCTTEGAYMRQCSVCATTEWQYTPASEHTGELITGYEATCTECGMTDGVVCTVCGQIVSGYEIISPLGHSFTEWIVTSAPTCTEHGEQYAVCSVCSATEYEKISPNGHTVEEWTVTVEPTCTGWGEQQGTCLVCNQVAVMAIEPTYHTMDQLEYYAPTCTEYGSHKATCSVCGAVDNAYGEIYPPLGHDFVDGFCTRCGQISSCESEHTYADRFEKKWGICLVCGYVDDNHEHAIKDGTCVYCDYVIEEVEHLSVFDNDGDGNSDIYYFAAALPERFTTEDAIHIDAFRDASGNHMEYDEIRAGSGILPYPHAYCYDGSNDEMIYTITVAEAGTYEMAVHIRLKDQKTRGAMYTINKDTENEYSFCTTYGWTTADEAYGVRNNDFLIGAYMTGIMVELQAGENTIHITCAPGIAKVQHFRDLYLVKADKTDSEAEQPEADLPKSDVFEDENAIS